MGSVALCSCRAARKLLICREAPLLTIRLHHTSPLSTRATASLGLPKSEASCTSHCSGVGQLLTASSTAPLTRPPAASKLTTMQGTSSMCALVRLAAPK